jgi:hypothetical protein
LQDISTKYFITYNHTTLAKISENKASNKAQLISSFFDGDRFPLEKKVTEEF